MEFRTLYLFSDDRVASETLDVIQFLPGDAWMFLGSVEREQPPHEAPQHTQSSTSVENAPPSVTGDEETAQHVRQTHAKTEPCRHPAGNLPQITT